MTETVIHNTSIVEKGAELGSGVQVGPMCYVGADAKLGDGVVLKSGVIVEGDTTIGARARIHAFAVLGGPPQHLKYSGEPTKLRIGDDAVIREHVTMNVGTHDGGGLTDVGDRGYFMIGSHVAHDCQIGDDVIISNNAAIGGHVEIEDGAFLGGQCAIHQFCRIGAFAFVGGGAIVTTSIIPYCSVFGNHAHLEGLNIIGMKRRGMERATIHKIRSAYRDLFFKDGTFKERYDYVRECYGECAEVMRILQFISKDAKRPLMMPA